ncbi:MAG TPA: DUF2341 domain-containing protein [Chitinivibrionales bacterium]|nr:DUF2341 domain-containing protein [Chitinivibrionales bacterium]
MSKRLTACLTLLAAAALVAVRCTVSTRVAETPADDFPNAVAGLVTDENGTPVAGAGVYVRSSDSLGDTALASGQVPAPDAFTDANGQYYFDSLPNGRYLVEIAHDTLGAAIACTLQATGKTKHTLKTQSLKPVGFITGTVRYTGATPVYVRTFGLLRAARVDPVSGSYLLPRVPQGNFSLLYSAFSDAVPPVSVSNVVVDPGFPTHVDTMVLQMFDEEDYSQWPYSRTVHLVTTPAGADVADTVMNFPVLVRLDQSAIAFGQTQTDGQDIRFAKKNGRHLRYEIERWDPAARIAAVWVNVDTVYGNDTTDIIMYWGKKNTGNFSDGGQVFGRTFGYMGVWHMNGTDDASGLGHSLVTQSAATTPAADTGLIGGAMRFNGSAYWAVPYSSSIDGNNRFSISVWAQWLGAAVPGYNRIISNKRAWNDSAGFELLTISGNDSAIDIRAEDSIGNGPLNVIGGWSLHGWHYITLVWNNGVCAIYVDGSYISAPLINAFSNVNDLVFGSNVGNTEQKWIGCIDEVRLSSGPLSAGWVKLCYMNQKPQDALCKF